MNTGNMPHGYTNQTQQTPRGILKRYTGPGALNRWQTEMNILPIIKNALPVPMLLENKVSGELITKKINGLHGLDLLAEGKSIQVLVALGNLLKLVQKFPAQKLQGIIPGNGDVLVHGDYGPQNLLLHPKSLETIAIVDWEWAHLGETYEDVASVEWTIRMFHTNEVSHLPLFFEAYGDIPAWEDRHQAMMMICQRQLEFARLIGKRKNIQQAQNRIYITNRLLPF
jgi:tRNA A-37 threonylcarbamoyl transferase component Bud32